MLRILKVLVFSFVSLSSVAQADGFRLPSSQFGSLTLSDDGTVVIGNPGFFDGLSQRPIAASSNLNGVCNLFGYGPAVPATLRTASTDGGDEGEVTLVAVINGAGMLSGRQEGVERIEALGCRGDAYERGGRYERLVINTQKVALIQKPMLHDLRGGRWGIASDSDLQGVCRLFGFNRVAPGELIMDSDNAAGVVINNVARVAGTKSTNAISSLLCQDDIGSYWPRVNLVEEKGGGLNLVTKPRWNGYPISYHSNQHDVCAALGFASAVGGVEKEKVDTNVEISAAGELVRTREFGLGYASLMCTTLSVDAKDVNLMTPQGESSFLVKKPRVEIDSPRMAEVSAASDHDGLCRHFGFSAAIKDTAKPVFWQDGVRQVVFDDQGNFASKAGFGLVIADIQCKK